MAKVPAKKFIFFLLYLLGFSLWLPNISLLSVAEAWGFQITLLITFLLCIPLLFNIVFKHRKFPKINNFSEYLSSHTIFTISIISSTLLSSVGIGRSIKTLGVELIGVSFSLIISFWLCKDIKYFINFIKGFKFGGLLSGVYGIYQIIGLPLDLPFAYISLSNPSFSTVELAFAKDILRAFALTPEPSILASLLWVMVGINTIEVLIYGGIKRYLYFMISFLGIIATGSQSIVLLPLYIIIIFLLNYCLNPSPRKLKGIDGVLLLALLLSAFFGIVTNTSIVTSLSRVTSLEANTSAVMRFNDIVVGFEMFSQNPLIGWGLGSVSELMPQFTRKLGSSLVSEGITSGFFRIIAEQGIIGLSSLIFSFICIAPLKLNRYKEQDDLALSIYQLSFVISGVVSLFLFVGYRNLYHLWLILPMGLSFKSFLKKIRKTN